MSSLPGILVETDWLADHLGDSDLRVMDCSALLKDDGTGKFVFVSGRDEWLKAHIPGSIHIDVLTQLSDRNHSLANMLPDEQQLARVFGEHGIGNDSKVVLYDRGNHAWATRVFWILAVCGFSNVAVLNGGWRKWQAEGREQTSGEERYPATSFSVRHQPQLIASKQDVLAAVHGSSPSLLVNALPPPVFTGERKVYARAGRIPGSCNVSCDTLLAENFCYLDEADLRARFDAVGALNADQVIVYCGGGIAASSNFFTLYRLGQRNVALYDGSLSEWTIDESLPMECDFY